MKRYLSGLINQLYKKDLELLYGEGSHVDISNIRYITNKKDYSIECTLHVADVTLFEESQSEGLNYIVSESWKYTGFYENRPTLVTKFNII